MKPLIPAQARVKELTLRSLGIGIIFSFFFAIANTYLGLKIGQTISASIPAAVLSLGMSRALFRNRVSVLEHNIIQTIATMGEGMAGAIVFTLPALLLLGESPSFLKVVLLSLLGGLLGILFMIPMRRFLIVEEHGRLPYPEGTACASILIAGAKAGKDAVFAAYGFGVAALYKIFMNGFFLWNEVVSFPLRFLPMSRLSMDATPALLGVGYLIRFRISALVFCGGLVGWLVIIPLISIFGQGVKEVIYPGNMPIPEMDSNDLWSHYVRYIGAGAVGMGGILQLFKVMPLLWRALRDGVQELLGRHAASRHEERTDRDISMKWLVLGSLATILALWVIPYFDFNLLTIVLLTVLALFFVAISSIACGVVGSSSSPVSGMLITVLLITSCVYLALGWVERAYLLSALTLSIVACTAIGLAGNTSQDLKTGFLLGATPWKQQLSQIVGLIIPSLVIGTTISILNQTYHIGSELMPAPQANLLAMVVQGVMQKTLPLALVGIGVVLAILLAILSIPVIPFAIGLYLPLFLSTPIFIGGCVRAFVRNQDEGEDGGTLFASGLVGGDALLGVLLAIGTVLGIMPAEKMGLLSDGWTWFFFGILSLILYTGARYARR